MGVQILSDLRKMCRMKPGESYEGGDERGTWHGWAEQQMWHGHPTGACTNRRSRCILTFFACKRSLTDDPLTHGTTENVNVLFRKDFLTLSQSQVIRNHLKGEDGARRSPATGARSRFSGDGTRTRYPVPVRWRLCCVNATTLFLPPPYWYYCVRYAVFKTLVWYNGTPMFYMRASWQPRYYYGVRAMYLPRVSAFLKNIWHVYGRREVATGGEKEGSVGT